MGHELATLFAAGFVYLLLLFLVAYATDRDWLPSHWAAHPLTYTLSIGVYATSWTYYGSVGYASVNGLLFLTIYIGATLAFVLSPVMVVSALPGHHPRQFTDPPYLPAWLRQYDPATGTIPIWGSTDVRSALGGEAPTYSATDAA